MTSPKPSIPKGTRDFGTTEMVRRNYIFDIIRSVFQRYGYKPIETPAIENLSTLLGKYGEECDRLIFKILNSGDFLSEVPGNSIEGKISGQLIKYISEKALRYDLTVPFARFVVMYRNKITFPFKRYQIQPVWRADRPQKGRYREFYQCDVDVIGSDSLLNEVELIQLTIDIFKKLGIEIKIKINNRKILKGIAELVNESDKFVEITTAIDKIDKIGYENVVEELKLKGISQENAEKIISIILYGKIGCYSSYAPIPPAPGEIVLSELFDTFKYTATGLEGVNEIATISSYISFPELNVEFDISLARGLNYYTAAIFEVVINPDVYKNIKMGSIGGGGRYDDLTGIFGLPNVSGVGISFGADRIYDVMQELKLFPENAGITTQLLFVNFGANEEKYCLPLVAEARKKGINTELYPGSPKMKKQLDYANSNNIPYVAIVGTDEMNSGMIALKNMHTGEQLNMNFQDLVSYIADNAT